MVRFRNKGGVIPKACNCGSWLKHYEIFSGIKATLCGERICGRNAVYGGHVINADSNSPEAFIVPLCEMHYNPDNYKVMELYSRYDLNVSANQGKTCGY